MRPTIAAALAVLTLASIARAEAPGEVEPLVIVGERARVGTKTSTPIRDIPATVEVITEQRLREQGAANLDQALPIISGGAQSSSNNYGFFNNYLLRGLPMSFLRDGVPDGPTINGYPRTLTNVARVEVLKGPGSALYGSSAAGGTINLVGKPALYGAYGELSQSYGSYGYYQTLVDAGGNLPGTPAGTRVNGGVTHTGGYRGLYNNVREVSPRLELKTKSAGTFVLDYQYIGIDMLADGYGTPFQGTTLLGVDRGARFYSPFSEVNQMINRVALSHDAALPGDWTLHQNATWLHRDLEQLRDLGGKIAAGAMTMTGRTLRHQIDDTNDFVYQLEPTWNGRLFGLDHVILTGIEYQYHQFNSFQETAALPNITNVYVPQVPETSNAELYSQNKYAPRFRRYFRAHQDGVYAQDQADLTEKWKARVGGRLDQFHQYDFQRVTGSATTLTTNTGSYQVGTTYEIIPSVSLFAGVMRSWQSNFSTELAAVGPPERGTMYEAGAKSEFYGGKLKVNVSGYRVELDNALLTVGGVVVGVGSQHTNGVESTYSAAPLPGLELEGSWAYQDAELDDNGSDVLSVGRRPSGVPVWADAGWMNYTLQEGAARGLGAGIGYVHKGMIYKDNDNTQNIPAYLVANAAVFYRRPSWELRLGVTNLTDKRYFSHAVIAGALPGDPRAVMATVRVRLGKGSRG